MFTDRLQVFRDISPRRDMGWDVDMEVSFRDIRLMALFHKLLLLEDDQGFAESIARVFAEYNVLLDTAPDGRVGLMWLKQRPYDCVITDLRMPILGGFDFIEEAGKLLAAVPLLVMTASGQKNDVMRARTLGVTGYLMKPIRPTDLLQRLGEVVKNPPGLVRLADFPASVSFKSLGSEGAQLAVTGCAGEDFEVVFRDIVGQMHSLLGEVVRLELTVNKEFGYHPLALSLIEKAMAAGAKRLKLSSAKLELKGDFWQDAKDVPGARSGIFAQAVWP